MLYQFRLDSSGYYFRESITPCFRSTLFTPRNAKCERKIRSCLLLLLPLSFSHLFSSITSLRFIACSISNRNRTNVNAGEGCNSEIRCNPTRGVRSEIVPLDKEMRDVMSARVTLKLKSTCSNEILARRVGLAVTVSRYFVPCPLVTCTLYRILAVFCCSITRKAVL